MKKETNTSEVFKFKWQTNKKLAFDATLTEGSEIQKWILNRNGWKNLEDLKKFLSDKKRVLDAGCGNGRVTKLLKMCAPSETEIVGIDISSADIAKENLKDEPNVFILEKDILSDLSDLGLFDFIYCQEVLHHTKDPFRAFTNLAKQLNNKGVIAIYVYKKKAPIREFTDEFLRNKLKDYEFNQALDVCRKITELGKILHDLQITIKIPDIPELGIVGGEYSIQRFIYHFFMKCFWNPELIFEENVMINFDWYLPQECSRHTIEEVEEWFNLNNLKIIHRHVDHYGITIHGQKI